YQHSLSNKVSKDTSVFDISDTDGTDNSVCPIVVYSLVSEQLPIINIKTQKSHAIWYFKNDNGVLTVSHAENPESIYNNSSLYSFIFSWLFPYGLREVRSS
ncbi:hypothetical protein EV421DRAFT_1685353, partial [Armillaria borealis]